MKTKFLFFCKAAFVFSALLVLTNSCTKEKWYDSVSVYNDTFSIKNYEWRWNNNMNRYEYSFNYPTTVSEYENGVFNASVFLQDGSVEIQTPLPYIRTWDEDGVKYTETLSFDVSREDGTILFYIQASDLVKTDQSFFPNYWLKISLIHKN